ncbi:hypothetical protein [Pontibacter vulgaris]|uniref:hypothetical protein n=1 Tax=Pontibacter vulgaris TaxID=2905679 RepID=UPI001FA7D785|nr:hypothetical protein [Pontibacter vulgaris]
MTKGHNKEREDKNKPSAEHNTGKHQTHHLKDQDKEKGPQGRHKEKDQSGGTKGQNAI